MSERDCTNCENWKAQEPTPHPGRIFTEDLRISMVIRRHNAGALRKLLLIISEPGKTTVGALQFRKGYVPCERDVYLANAGLQPFEQSGGWSVAWCEEVT